MAPHPDFGNLQHDLQLLQRIVNRRNVLRFMAGASLLPLIGCTTTTTTTNDAGVTCSTIPEETEGPYPGDGSNQNGTNALAMSGIVRSDIRSSFGSASATPSGVLLTVNLTLVSTRSSCDPLSGYAVYVWHCDNQGRYSLYSSGITSENYLRGVQATDSNGKVSFTTFFPACYSGRWPHIHFEIYPTLVEASSYSNKIATSQMAMPEDLCDTVFATSSYSGSASNLAKTSLSKDMVFSDGYSLELPTFSGDATSGYVSNLTVGVDA